MVLSAASVTALVPQCAPSPSTKLSERPVLKQTAFALTSQQAACRSWVGLLPPVAVAHGAWATGCSVMEYVAAPRTSVALAQKIDTPEAWRSGSSNHESMRVTHAPAGQCTVTAPPPP